MLAIRCLVALTLVFGSVVVVQAQTSSQNRRDEQRENARVHNAQRDVDAAKKHFSDLQKVYKARINEVEELEEKLVKHKRTLRLAEEFAEQEIGKSIGIPEAMAKTKQARLKLDEMAAPVLEKLHSSADWKAIQEKVQTAREERQSILADVESEDDARDKRLREVSKIIAMPSEVEDKALADDPSCASATMELTESVKALDLLRMKISDAQVKKHPKVVAAQKEVDANQKSLGEANKALASAKSSATSAQKSLASAQSKLAKAKADDARDPNNGKPRKK